MAQYETGISKMVEAKIGDKIFRPFKPGKGEVLEVKGTKIKVRLSTGGTRWYPSYKWHRS